MECRKCPPKIPKLFCTVQYNKFPVISSPFPCSFGYFSYSEAEFLDVIGTKVLRAFLLAFNSHLYLTDSTPSPPLRKSGLKLVCNVNIVYGNLESENSPDYAQKPQRNEIVRS